ncbi:MAG: hypothetical protein Q8N51_18420 [Gammaproteobacteria bacterium]|nr:hypothetical protein [Gammaproteobacteria bacterium]
MRARLLSLVGTLVLFAGYASMASAQDVDKSWEVDVYDEGVDVTYVDDGYDDVTVYDHQSDYRNDGQSGYYDELGFPASVGADGGGYASGYGGEYAYPTYGAYGGGYNSGYGGGYGYAGYANGSTGYRYGGYAPAVGLTIGFNTSRGYARGGYRQPAHYGHGGSRYRGW